MGTVGAVSTRRVGVTVVLLSAGTGRRMLPLTVNTPKCLLEIGGGTTVIESQLASIARVEGIERVLVVVGYLADQVEAKLRRHDDLPLSFVYNPFFDLGNNLVSLWTALPHLSGDYVIINGDNLFRPPLLANLLAAPGDDGIVMVIDRKPFYDEDDMKVRLTERSVTAVSKQIPVDEADGESIGMIRVRGRGRTALAGAVAALLREDGFRDVFYLQALQRLMDEGYPVAYCACDPSEWREVDFHPDLDHIRTQILEGVANFVP